MMELDGALIVRAHAAPWHNGVEFLAMQDNCVGVYVGMEEVKERFQTTKSTFTLRYDEAQILMDDLWNAGLRPTEGAGSAGAMRAVESHLKDLRKIAFNRLKISE